VTEEEFPLGCAVFFVEEGQVRRGTNVGVIAKKVSVREKGGRLVAVDLRRCYRGEGEAVAARKVAR
jgi:hypothetical protein